MKFRGGEFPTGTKGNFQPELTALRMPVNVKNIECALIPVALAAVTVSPWIVRNIVEFHGGLLYSSQTGITALQGALAPQGRTQPGSLRSGREQGGGSLTSKLTVRGGFSFHQKWS